VAATLRAVSEGKGVACRYGGEEFVVILPGLDDDEAIALAEHMRLAIESSNPQGLRVTSSFGVSSWTSTTRSRAELIAQSDKALYISKKAGRNCVTHARILDAQDFLKAS
jgi:diguanylate cyclase (GGDEF)-like protein